MISSGSTISGGILDAGCTPGSENTGMPFSSRPIRPPLAAASRSSSEMSSPGYQCA